MPAPDELDCPGCMSDDIDPRPGDCDPECLLGEGHEHWHCRECGYDWTER